MFFNLFFGLDSRFSDHNFSNFLDRLEQYQYVRLETHLQASWIPWRDRRCRFDPNEFEAIFRLTLSPETCASFFRTYPSLPVVERDYYLSKLCQFIWLIVVSWIDSRADQEASYDHKLQEILDTTLDSIPDGMLTRLRDFNWGALHRDLRDSDRTMSTVETAKNLLRDLSGYLIPDDLDDTLPSGAGSDGLSARRKALLQQFIDRGGKKATVYRSSQVDKSDFYRWLKGELTEQSVMTHRIEQYLNQALATPLTRLS